MVVGIDKNFACIGGLPFFSLKTCVDVKIRYFPFLHSSFRKFSSISPIELVLLIRELAIFGMLKPSALNHQDLINKISQLLSELIIAHTTLPHPLQEDHFSYYTVAAAFSFCASAYVCLSLCRYNKTSEKCYTQRAAFLQRSRKFSSP